MGLINNWIIQGPMEIEQIGSCKCLKNILIKFENVYGIEGL